MEIIREHKPTLITILSGRASFVLQHVEQAKLITTHEYEDLKDDMKNHGRQDFTTNLLDTIRRKGDKSCLKFLEVLQQDEMKQTFPQLDDLLRGLHPAVRQDVPEREASDPTTVNEYRMSSIPRGLCVIINNVHFEENTDLDEREGSDSDEKSLKEVFTWLGFKPIQVHRDQTAQQMKDLLKSLGETHHDGDCFVCCILSHGCAEGVYGTDGGIVKSVEDIFSPFRGTSCKSLAGKPKVFFIQACRGKDYQLPVEVEADTPATDEGEEVAMDAIEIITIPNDADFYVARSTIKGFLSFRNTLSGSWFIQALCKQLRKYCPRSEDIQTILLCVNHEVSRKAARVIVDYKMVTVKQMPVQKVTLRKKLVFRVPVVKR